MRWTTVLTASSLLVLTMAATACSNGSKKAAPATTTSAPAPAAAGGAGAGTDTSAAANGASTSVNVCSLLTAPQASTIIGVTYTAATPSFGGKTCTYASTAAPTPMTITVTTNAGNAAAWRDELGTLQLGGGETPVTITGVGDRAATSVGSLGTQSGSWIVQIDGGDPTTPGGAFTESIAVAKAMIAALH